MLGGRFFTSVLILMVATNSLPIARSATDISENAALIDKIMSRASIVFSGRMEYSVSSPYHQDGPLKIKYSFADTNWATRQENGIVDIIEGDTKITYNPIAGKTERTGEFIKGARMQGTAKEKKHFLSDLRLPAPFGPTIYQNI